MNDMTIEKAMSPYSYPHENNSPEAKKLLLEKWTFLVGEIESLRALLKKAETSQEKEMLRTKACEHIAGGDEGWEKLSNECPSTAAVASLRRTYESIKRK